MRNSWIAKLNDTCARASHSVDDFCYKAVPTAMFCSSDVRSRCDRKIKSDAKTYWLCITMNRHARTNIFQEAQIVVWWCLRHIDSLAHTNFNK